jgi:prepilin-type N-terminal cleavage/methylation domain-containing protein
MRRPIGFTLIELLVTCSILAAIACVAWASYDGVDRRAEDALAHTELLRLAGALQRFHDDTGYWPGEGPWRLAADDDNTCPGSGGAIRVDELPLAGFVKDEDRAGWFDSPANFSLLFERPTLCQYHPLAFLAKWNPAAQRGWNGPYLPLANRHWVDVWLDLGDEPLGGGDAIRNVPGFAAGPAYPPGGAGYASCPSALPGCFLGWRSLPRPLDNSVDNGYDDAVHEFSRHARPFIFLLASPDPINPENDGPPRPRVIYWGPDGRFGGTNKTDPCQPDALDPKGKDDVVICLAASLPSS